MTKKLRVAVLLGGSSNEKETSLDSGRNIVYKLSPHKYEVIPIFVSSRMELFIITPALLVRNSTKEIECDLAQATKITWDSIARIADFVFIGLHGGLGESGAVQGALEMLGVPYNGSSVLASALCMDKFKTTQFLRAQGIDVPQSLLINASAWRDCQDTLIATITATFSFPLIVKPHDDGCSVMVQKATTNEQLVMAIETLFTNHKQTAMIEEFITGMELTVGVLGNDNPRALPPSQAIATGGILSVEEKFLPGAGENQTPAPLAHESLCFVQSVIEKVYKIVGCKGYARIDGFYQSAQQSKTGAERVIIIEINTLPGLTPATCIFHQAAEIGLRPTDFIDRIVQLGLEEHTLQQQHDNPPVVTATSQVGQTV